MVLPVFALDFAHSAMVYEAELKLPYWSLVFFYHQSTVE